MARNNQYPLKYYLIQDFDETQIIQSTSFWQTLRGFIPTEPLVSGHYLVQRLYTLDGEFITYQLRDTSTDEVNDKYKIVNKVYDFIVKLDTFDLKGAPVICESTMDCALLRSLGINAFCTLGVKRFNLKKTLEFFNQDYYTTLFHNDRAGMYARKMLQNQCLQHTVPPFYKDLCEYYKRDKKSCLAWLDDVLRLSLQQEKSELLV